MGVNGIGMFGKWQERVRQAVHHMRQRLPFHLLGIDSDNGSEFINKCFYNYCRDERITFTRSRSYKKNDSCHVEQKNGNVVRRLVGHDRYDTKAAFECLRRAYDLVWLYTNFFQPTMKLVSKTKHGAKVHKVYDTAQIPIPASDASRYTHRNEADRTGSHISGAQSGKASKTARW